MHVEADPGTPSPSIYALCLLEKKHQLHKKSVGTRTGCMQLIAKIA
jgi:hypothetical protein